MSENITSPEPIHNRFTLKEFRKELRSDPTPEEYLLWQHVKGKKTGFKIRRQHSVLNYIIDFYCASKRLGIELDGAQHYTKEGKEYDKIRDKELYSLNIKIIRFPNSQINSNLKRVIEKIKLELQKR